MKMTFDKATVSLDALQRAAYGVGDVASVEINTLDGVWACDIFPRDADASHVEIEHRLRTEVIDQQLRLRIGAETESVRNVVFALAFSRTGLAGEGPTS